MLSLGDRVAQVVCVWEGGTGHVSKQIPFTILIIVHF